MKKFLLFVLICICLCSFTMLTACSGAEESGDSGAENNQTEEQPSELPAITGVTFEGLTVDYDGQPKTIEVSGALDTDEIIYSSSNTKTDAGTYDITATIKRVEHKDLVLQATLKINKIEIAGVVFNDGEFDYDGQAKSLFIEEETLPQGVSVQYSGNGKVDADEYIVTATISGKNYITKTIQATLNINKIEITGVVFKSVEFKYDGQAKSIFVDEESLPVGVSVQYVGNGMVDADEYIVIATISGKNYITTTIQATLKIKKDVVQVLLNAKEIIDKLLDRPDAWAFLPDSLSLDSLKNNTIQTIDFSTGFVSVGSIPKNGIGKQLNVMYEILSRMEKVVGCYDKIASISVTLVNAYQTFLNDNPEDYTVFEKHVGGFDFRIELDGNQYQMLVGVGPIALEIYCNGDSYESYGRAQLNESTAVKFVRNENELDIKVKAIGLFAGSLSFVRDDETVTGQMFEFYGTESLNIKTSAIINVDSQYTTIISDKREGDDLIVEGYVEVYENSTGRFVGAEVKETVKKKDYDTMWFNLFDVSGINSIKVIPEKNIMNADTIYINGSSDNLHSKNVSLLNASRRFDIEMKEMYFYVYNETNEEFEKVCMKVPMLFVQKDNLSTFGEDFYDENESSGCSSIPVITIGSTKISYINSAYEEFVEEFIKLKEEVTYTEIVNAVGNKNSFFD